LNPGYLIAFVLLLIPGYLIYRIRKYGGFKGALFGARVRETIGEAVGPVGHIATSRIKVYALDGAPERAVGVELYASGGESRMMTAVSLDETERLIEFLKQARNLAASPST
jgi:hypothetical protein